MLTTLHLLSVVRRLEAGGGQQPEGLPPPALLSASEAAGLLAAAESLRQHTAQLEQQGLLQVAAGVDGGAWLTPGSAANHAGQREGAWGDSSLLAAIPGATSHLPAYLQEQQGPQLGSAAQHTETGLQRWLPCQMQLGPADIDAIQEADEGGITAGEESGRTRCRDERVGMGAVQPECASMQAHTSMSITLRCRLHSPSAGFDGWAALEGGADLEEQTLQQQGTGSHQPVPLSLGLRRGQLAGAVVGVAFDDDDEQQLRCGDLRQLQAGGGKQGTLSELWEGRGVVTQAGVDPWGALDEAGPGAHSVAGLQQAQERQQPQAALRVPTFAARRQPLAFSQRGQGGGAGGPQQQAQADEDGSGDSLLQEVAALEQQAPGGRCQLLQPQEPQQRPQLRAPVFRNRSLAQHQLPSGGSLPASSAAAGSASADRIEEPDSDGEVAARPDARAGSEATAPNRGGQTAVPQLGRHAGMLQLSHAAPSIVEEAPSGTSIHVTSSVCRPAKLAARRQAAAAAADVPLLEIDFASLDLEALRPSVLLGWATAGECRTGWPPSLLPCLPCLSPHSSRPSALAHPFSTRPPAAGVWQEAGSGGSRPTIPRRCCCRCCVPRCPLPSS